MASVVLRQMTATSSRSPAGRRRRAPARGPPRRRRWPRVTCDRHPVHARVPRDEAGHRLGHHRHGRGRRGAVEVSVGPLGPVETRDPDPPGRPRRAPRSPDPRRMRSPPPHTPSPHTPSPHTPSPHTPSPPTPSPSHSIPHTPSPHTTEPPPGGGAGRRRGGGPGKGLTAVLGYPPRGGARLRGGADRGGAHARRHRPCPRAARRRQLRHLRGLRPADRRGPPGGARNRPDLRAPPSADRSGDRGARLSPQRRGPPVVLHLAASRSGAHGRRRAQPFLVSQKMLSMAAIWSSSSWPTAASVVFFASPARLVAFQNSSWSWGYFSRCSGLK